MIGRWLDPFAIELLQMIAPGLFGLELLGCRGLLRLIHWQLLLPGQTIDVDRVG